MPLQTKYLPVIKLMKDLGIREIKTKEERGCLIIHGIASNEKDRELIIKKVSQVNKEEASDVRLEVKVDYQEP